MTATATRPRFTTLEFWLDRVMSMACDSDDHRERLVVLRDAMTRLEAERERLRDEQKRAVVAAVEAGVANESELGRLCGVSRLTIRSWLGKSV